MAPSKSPAPPHHCNSPKMRLSKHENVVCYKFKTICKPNTTLRSGKRKEKHLFSSKQPVLEPPRDRSSRRTHCSCQPCRATSRAEGSRASTSSYLSLSLQKVMAHCLSSFWQSAKYFCLFHLKAKREATGARWTEVLFGRGALEDWKTGTKYYLEEVQADRQTKDPSGHRRFDF